MASVLSLQQKWSEEEQPNFKGMPSFSLIVQSLYLSVNGQFKPLRDSVNSGESKDMCQAKLFMLMSNSFRFPLGMVHH